MGSSWSSKYQSWKTLFSFSIDETESLVFWEEDSLGLQNAKNIGHSFQAKNPHAANFHYAYR